MSHFIVMVTGENVEAQLAPFDENAEVPQYRKYTSEEDVQRMAAHYKLPVNDLHRLAAKLEDWTGNRGGIDVDGLRLYSLSTYNTRSKWDWYAIGGRWSGYLKLKPRAKRIKAADEGLHDSPPPRGHADICRKRDVDTAGMEAAAVQTATERFDLYEQATAGTPPNKTWDAIRSEFPDDVDAAREAYQKQPRIAALLTTEAGKALQQREDFLVEWDGYLIGREAYIEKARLGAFAPFALLHDGEWYEHGEMGWFGMAKNEKEDWPEQFRKIWDSLPDDTLLTMVDCHI